MMDEINLLHKLKMGDCPDLIFKGVDFDLPDALTFLQPGHTL